MRNANMISIEKSSVNVTGGKKENISICFHMTCFEKYDNGS